MAFSRWHHDSEPTFSKSSESEAKPKRPWSWSLLAQSSNDDGEAGDENWAGVLPEYEPPSDQNAATSSEKLPVVLSEQELSPKGADSGSEPSNKVTAPQPKPKSEVADPALRKLNRPKSAPSLKSLADPHLLAKMNATPVPEEPLSGSDVEIDKKSSVSTKRVTTKLKRTIKSRRKEKKPKRKESARRLGGSSVNRSVDLLDDPDVRGQMLLFLSSLNLSMPMWDFLHRWGSDHLCVVLPLAFGIHSTILPASLFDVLNNKVNEKYNHSVRAWCYWAQKMGAIHKFWPAEFASLHHTSEFLDAIEKEVEPTLGHVHSNVRLADPLLGCPFPVTAVKVVQFIPPPLNRVLLQFKYESTSVPPRKIYFHRGGSLRLDEVTMSVSHFFNLLWRAAAPFANSRALPSLCPIVRTFRIISTKKNCGLIEYASGSPLEFEELVAGLKASPYRDNLLCTASAASLMSFVLGMRDRTRSNVLVDKAGHCFHVDIGGLFKAPSEGRFSVPKELRAAMSPADTEVFYSLIGEAYRVLRRQRGMVSHFLTQLYCDLYTEEVITKHLNSVFCDKMNEDRAVVHALELARADHKKEVLPSYSPCISCGKLLERNGLKSHVRNCSKSLAPQLEKEKDKG